MQSHTYDTYMHIIYIMHTHHMWMQSNIYHAYILYVNAITYISYMHTHICECNHIHVKCTTIMQSTLDHVHTHTQRLHHACSSCTQIFIRTPRDWHFSCAYVCVMHHVCAAVTSQRGQARPDSAGWTRSDYYLIFLAVSFVLSLSRSFLVCDRINKVRIFPGCCFYFVSFS